MKKQETKRITIMISEDKHKDLTAQAILKGISLPTFCRVLLSEQAEHLKAA